MKKKKNLLSTNTLTDNTITTQLNGYRKVKKKTE